MKKKVMKVIQLQTKFKITVKFRTVKLTGRSCYAKYAVVHIFYLCSFNNIDENILQH